MKASIFVPIPLSESGGDLRVGNLHVSTSTPSPDGLDDVFQAVEATSRDTGTLRSPAMEIIEEPTAFVLVCDMVGAEREDIRVDVSPHRVVIAALPRSPVATVIAGKGASTPYQDFERAVPLPSEVNPESAEARLNNGILEVTLPKKKLGGSGVYRLPAM